MAPTKFPKQSPEETLTLTVKKSTRNVFFAKMIILLGLTLFTSYFYVQDVNRKYERGHKLTKEKYLEEFDEYKGILLNYKKQLENPLFSTFIVLIMVSFLIGSHELTALGIGFIIGKLPRRRV
jgi:predicted PurR-regulated permease PerM